MDWAKWEKWQAEQKAAYAIKRKAMAEEEARKEEYRQRGRFSGLSTPIKEVKFDRAVCPGSRCTRGGW